MVYIAVHNYVPPVLMGAIAIYSKNLLLGEAGLIWIAHISVDRLLGYGLKYPLSFKLTHIQRVADP